MFLRFSSRTWSLLIFLIASICGAFIVAACGSSNNSTTAGTMQQIRHVFIITLENENYATTFGTASKAPYLSQTLAAQGALVQNYYGTGHVSLDNYISMISGQAPTLETDNDCFTYDDYKLTGMTPDGQAIGTGCVFPASIKTLPDQLKAAGFTWKGYEEDMGNDPSREAATCGHPTLNTTDLTDKQEAPSAAVPLGDQYASRHDPFVYFHSIIDSPDCQTNVVNLDKLQSDLQSVSTTANFNFITPNTCDDGHDAPCVNGQPGGLTSANAFLEKWVPIITSSPAFQQDGMLIINFDESSYASESFDTTTNPPTVMLTYAGATCCGQQPGPNLAAFPQVASQGTYPTSSVINNFPQFPLSSYQTAQFATTKSNYGGDQTGAVMISKFIKPGTVSTVPYNHYSMLRSIEDIFGLDHLGYAGQAGLVPFGKDIFTSL
ncbi:alkaline phosphatase family protein [Burkholderia sp. Ax-1719]|uniref:alkaline phosphatase family protein n=1 Tax=Burkholderia sp. Ax-1719 TaxID=2608334 RepID=UPI00141DC05E|nr:alkaline phosphatase family protein [Burkholderia sp. Ax-1719]NIE66916.1 phosphoesterase [Burkholderia sp. Ax-1719]